MKGKYEADRVGYEQSVYDAARQMRRVNEPINLGELEFFIRSELDNDELLDYTGSD